MLLKHPFDKQKTRKEISAASPRGKLSKSLIRWETLYMNRLLMILSALGIRASSLVYVHKNTDTDILCDWCTLHFSIFLFIYTCVGSCLCIAQMCVCVCAFVCVRMSEFFFFIPRKNLNSFSTKYILAENPSLGPVPSRSRPSLAGAEGLRPRPRRIGQSAPVRRRARSVNPNVGS